jgi:hypothetical protein
MGFVQIVKTWPNVLLSVRRAPRDAEEFEAYKVQFKELYATCPPGTKFHLVIDLTPVSSIPVYWVLQQVAFMKSQEMSTKDLVSSLAIHVKSGIMKGLLDMVFFLKPAAVPIEIYVA